MYNYYEKTYGEITDDLRKQQEEDGTPDVESLLESDDTLIMPCDGMLFFPPIEEILTEYDESFECTAYGPKPPGANMCYTSIPTTTVR